MKRWLCALLRHWFAVRSGIGALAVDVHDDSSWYLTTWGCQCGASWVTALHPTDRERVSKRCAAKLSVRCPFNAAICPEHAAEAEAFIRSRAQCRCGHAFAAHMDGGECDRCHCVEFAEDEVI